MTHISLKGYVELMRLHRPIGIALLLWPTLIALWMANDGMPSLKLFVIFSLGVVVMRSAGCVINDYADRNFDGHVQRTKERPLITGLVSTTEALILFFVLLVIGLALIGFTNLKTILLAPVAGLLAALYPFTKRYIQFPQVILGIAFAWAIPMVYSASDVPLSLNCWLLFSATIFWAIAYDTQYAMADKEEDIKVGVKSTAILFGEYDTLWIATCHFLMLSLLIIVGMKQGSGALFYWGIFIALGFALYQQWLIRNREPEKCLRAFLNNQWIGFVIFAGTFLDMIAL